MRSRRESEFDGNSLDSLLSWADDDEKRQIEALLKQLEQPTEAKNESGRRAPSPNESTVAKTRAEAAQLLGVDERTISKWMSDPTFPGKSGTAGQRNGHFPIAEIRRWRGDGQTDGGGDESPAAQLRLRKLAAEVVRVEIKNDRDAGKLIALEDQISTVVTAISSMRAILEEIPEWLAAEYPVDRPRSRKRARRVGRRVVERALQALDDALRADPDEDENEDDVAADQLARSTDGAKTPGVAATRDKRPPKRHAGRARGGAKAAP